MASLQFRDGDSYRVAFRYDNQQHVLIVGKVSEREAKEWQSKTENLLMRIKHRYTEVPPGCSIEDFIRFDGKPPVEPEFQVRKETTLRQLRDEYIATMFAERSKRTRSTPRRFTSPISKRRSVSISCSPA